MSTVQFPKAVDRDEVLVLGLRLIKGRSKVSEAANFRQIIVAFEVSADLLTIALAIRCGYLIYTVTSIGNHVQFPVRFVWAAGTAFAVVMVLMLDRAGAYRRGNSLLRVRETEQILRVSAEALVAALAVSFFAHVLIPRWLLVLCLILVPLMLFIEKTLIYLLVHRLHSRGYGNERVLIYGAGCTGRRVFSVLKGSPKLGLVPVLVVDDDPTKAGSTLFEMAYERRPSARIMAGPVTRDLLFAYGIDLVIVAIPAIGRDSFLNIVEEALAANARVSFVPSQFLSSDSWVDYRDIDGILLASFARPCSRMSYEVAKRACDFAGSLILIFLSGPIFVLVALLIKLDSQGPVFFRHTRVGRHGKPFTMYKFRTMRSEASAYDYSPRGSDDPRITPLGKFLRKSSLDELPQLFNVMEGKMSLVGPRPEMPFIVEQYLERHRQRLEVKPGLTGLWQLSGDRAFLIHENIEYDLYYIQHRNFFMDLAILLHTSIFAMHGT
ncbi:MAG: sugar transferase [Acidobacteria bacterium]|nr:sugar transferase [Acidobacteriota bacterium]